MGVDWPAVEAETIAHLQALIRFDTVLAHQIDQLVFESRVRDLGRKRGRRRGVVSTAAVPTLTLSTFITRGNRRRGGLAETTIAGDVTSSLRRRSKRLSGALGLFWGDTHGMHLALNRRSWWQCKAIVAIIHGLVEGDAQERLNFRPSFGALVEKVQAEVTDPHLAPFGLDESKHLCCGKSAPKRASGCGHI